ncbi:hypothetical protein WN943_006567 [Citrus x changshan-huyou]
MGPGHRVTKRVRAETVVASTIPQSQPVMPSQEFVQGAVTTLEFDIQPIKKRTRGPSRGKKTDDIVQLSGKIKLHISPETNRPVGHKYSSMLSSECGYLVRRFAPLQHEKWSKIPESEKQSKFDIDLNLPHVRRCVNNIMGGRYRDMRHWMYDHYLDYPSFEEALKHSYPGICPDDWAWLCHNIYNSASFQTQSTKNKANRAKLPYVHCGGSRPFVNYLEDDMVDGEIELFRVTHFSKTKGWVNEVAHLNHDQMVEIQQQQQTDPEEAKPLTQREICIEVLGKKSGYFRGLGNGPRPTSNHGVDTSEADRLHGIISSQQSRLDSQDVELQEQKKTIDQLESRLSQFEGMMQQFFSSQGSAFRFTDSAINDYSFQ